jgi:hypothetical protein
MLSPLPDLPLMARRRETGNPRGPASGYPRPRAREDPLPVRRCGDRFRQESAALQDAGGAARNSVRHAPLWRSLARRPGTALEHLRTLLHDRSTSGAPVSDPKRLYAYRTPLDSTNRVGAVRCVSWIIFISLSVLALFMIYTRICSSAGHLACARHYVLIYRPPKRGLERYVLFRFALPKIGFPPSMSSEDGSLEGAWRLSPRDA